MKIEAKRHTDMSNEDYHAGEGWSSTQIKDILISPAYFHAKHIAKTIQQEHKPAFLLGSVVHCMTLEPDEVDSRYIAEPGKFDRRTKEGKAAAAAFAEKANGKEILTADQWAIAEACRDAVFNCPHAGPLFEIGSDREVSYFAEDPETGLLIKCRPDMLIPGMGILDVKTVSPRPGWTADNLPRRLNRLIRDLGYHISAAMYCHITGEDEFIDLFVSTQEGNHWVAPYLLCEHEIELGMIQYRKAIRLLADCLETDEWPGPVGGFIDGYVTSHEMDHIHKNIM